MSKSSYQVGYVGMPSFNYAPIFDMIDKYFTTLTNYIDTVNAPCERCNNIIPLLKGCVKIVDYKSFTLYRYGDYFLVTLGIHSNAPKLIFFIPVSDDMPSVIREVFTTYYNDVTSDEVIPAFTIKGDFMGNQICFYLDRYQALTIYEQISEGYIYTPMDVSQKKKFKYREFLYNQGFTFKTKSNCSC